MAEDGILAVFRLGTANFDLRIISVHRCRRPFEDAGCFCAVVSFLNLLLVDL